MIHPLGRRCRLWLGMASLALLMALSPLRSQAQCPMCKAAVVSEHGKVKNELASGLNTGILYLFALPYASGIVILASILVTRRREKKRRLLKLQQREVKNATAAV